MACATTVTLALLLGFVLAMIVVAGTNRPTDTNTDDRESDAAYWYEVADAEMNKALQQSFQRGVAKNVIMFIGDGMSLPSVTAGRILAGQMKGQSGESFHLTFEHFPHTGLAKTYSVDKQVTDSAATATAFISGVKTRQGVLGMSAKAKKGDCASGQGNEVDSILKWFADEGRPTGIVTTTRVTHATPAATFCHSVDRKWESDHAIPSDQRQCSDIALQMVANASFINVIMGGGRIYFKPTSYKDPKPPHHPKMGKREDGRDLIQEWLDEKTQRNVTHAYVTNIRELFNVSDDTQHLLGLFSPSHMEYETRRDENQEPSLAQMTAKAIRLLQSNTYTSTTTKGSGGGFFLMVEGGRIDHGHHNNKPVRAIHEVVSFSEAVGVAVNMTDVHDTLIVVTADHSHTMSVAGYPDRGNPIFGKSMLNKTAIRKYVKDNMPYTTLVYANGPGYVSPRPNLTDVDTAHEDYRSQTAVPLSSETHGGEDVAIYARGRSLGHESKARALERGDSIL